jgi:hypothetical protein
LVESFLRRIQAELVELAPAYGSSVPAVHLKSSTKAHGSARLTAVPLEMVEQAAPASERTRDRCARRRRRSLGDPFPAPERELITIDTDSGILAPLERVRLLCELSGAGGLNRHASFPYIAAHNDLEAVRA